MLEPVGPLPPSVYWRRRAVAAIAAVLVLAFLIWAVSAAASADGNEDVAAPAPAPAGPTAPPTPVASRGALAVPPGAAPPVGAAPAGPVPAAPAPTSAAPGGATPPLLGAGSTGPQQQPPAGLPAPAGVPAPAGAPAPAAPPAGPSPTPRAIAPCADSDLRVAARTDKQRYTAAERPLFSLVVTNTGKEPCTRDLGPARTAMAVVIKPGDGLWGSDDCAPGGDPDVRTLAPGQEQVFSVRWAGRTSAPGCPSGREAVPPGSYQLLTRLDDTISDPARFTIAS
ncbi:hypothetical protein [Actinomycetospora soli]|uniref:hypothetical protein n=1 Tax=Actinomycetospora soli TaxID=2893887 RepID=UPI001E634E2F|nr:hypothetical protein [Actinomycetospora soli]MCD2190755.1 hypothetical protein [Actinomycetospora soli]